MKKTIFGVFTMLLLATTVDSRATSFELTQEGGEILVKGTSSLHDWVMNLNVINCEVQFNNEGVILKSIDKVNFSCRAKDLKSEHELMDKKTYEALKADNYPEIKFNSVSTTGLIVEEKKFRGELNGNLSVAGETRKISIPFTGTITGNNIINVSGQIDLKMSDFNIDPPTAMLGTLKTGDNISVSFSFRFKQKVQ